MRENTEQNSSTMILDYAPVIIPTLNRFEHFRRCLESLERCMGADQTDVYVGLDYPPSEKYVEGWKQIDNYLVYKVGHNNFRHLYVIRRDTNCGVSKSGSNASLLYKEAYDHSDSCIFSEDDNEFSVNFLEYMNHCLRKFSNDKSIMNICGYCFPENCANIDVQWFKAHFSNGWGVAKWKYKNYSYDLEGKQNFLNKVLYSWKLSWRLFSRRALSLNNMMSMHFSGQYYGDVFKTAEMILEDKYSVFPSVSKVRNWGHDGSGQHCLNSDLYTNQEIDSKAHFICPTEEPTQIDIKETIRKKNLKKIFIASRYLLFRLFDFDLLKIVKKNNIF